MILDWLVANGYADEEGFVHQDPNDPIAVWDVMQPTNVEDLNIHGWEIAAQHWFGETGFGVGANATFVSGDTKYDVANTSQQFALPGMSDSYNLAAFYDKDGLQARVVYNWRDEFLSSTGQAESGGPAPQFTEEYGQLDFSASYEFSE